MMNRIPSVLRLIVIGLVGLLVVSPVFAAQPSGVEARFSPAPAQTGDDDTDPPGALDEVVYPLDAEGSYERLLNRVGDARVVLIGEESHGTHEFYQVRAEITRQLILQKGFTAVAIEADWHSAFAVNDYVLGAGDITAVEDAFDEFERFPIWMWRNTVVADFVTWLRGYNDAQPSRQTQVGFYGLDLYGLYDSIEQVAETLRAADSESYLQARDLYQCFTAISDDPQAYGAAAARSDERSCQEEALAQFEQAVQLAQEVANDVPAEAALSLVQNARVIANSEEYYRSLYTGYTNTWNLRDRHMADIVDALLAYLEAQGADAKLVVWAHNSHVGDARATGMGVRGQLNLGQLMRERYGDEAVLIGFSTYTGTVTAAHEWGELPVVMPVTPGLPESYEALFHEAALPSFLMLLNEEEAAQWVDEPRLQRAIGVIYRPQTERASHYFMADLPEQFDAMIHIDETSALVPLDPIDTWQETAADLAGE